MGIRDDVRQILRAATPANDNRAICRVQVEHSGEITVHLVIHEADQGPPGGVERRRSSRVGSLMLNPAHWLRAVFARQG